jgi:hypothetical protein
VAVGRCPWGGGMCWMRLGGFQGGRGQAGQELSWAGAGWVLPPWHLSLSQDQDKHKPWQPAPGKRSLGRYHRVIWQILSRILTSSGLRRGSRLACGLSSAEDRLKPWIGPSAKWNRGSG